MVPNVALVVLGVLLMPAADAAVSITWSTPALVSVSVNSSTHHWFPQGMQSHPRDRRAVWGAIQRADDGWGWLWPVAR